MTLTDVLQVGEKFEIQAYKKPKDLKALGKTHVAFTGSPYKHPYNAEAVILVTDPLSSGTSYYEFRTTDIAYLEKLPSQVDMDGETVVMVRIWVEKGSYGVLCSPFVVADLGGGR